jgi:hypothetical protein
MIVDAPPASDPKDPHLLRWFLGGGALGLFAVIVIAIEIDRMPDSAVMLLWPGAIVQVIDPVSIADKAMVFAFSCGGNFLIYGVAGMAVGYLVSLAGTLIGHLSK